MKKTLIITAGLPGVGKSHLLRLIKKKLKCHYFDSDLFAKKYIKKHKINFKKLSNKEFYKKRIDIHKAKLKKILSLFKKYNIVILDTCFDMPKSRTLFYKFAKDYRVRLEVVEIKCPEKVVSQRIFKNRHEKERMIGTKKDRWEVYKLFKKRWKPIRKKHVIVYSHKELESQIKGFINGLK